EQTPMQSCAELGRLPAWKRKQVGVCLSSARVPCVPGPASDGITDEDAYFVARGKRQLQSLRKVLVNVCETGPHCGHSVLPADPLNRCIRAAQGDRGRVARQQIVDGGGRRHGEGVLDEVPISAQLDDDLLR